MGILGEIRLKWVFDTIPHRVAKAAKHPNKRLEHPKISALAEKQLEVRDLI